jgi:hypothetical protein
MRSLTLDYSLLVKELDEKIKNIFMPALLGEPELCIGSVGVAVFEVCAPSPPPPQRRSR